MSKIHFMRNQKVAAAGEAAVAEGEQEEAVEVAAGNNFLAKYFLKKGVR